MAFDIRLRVPEEFGQHIGAQLVEVRSAAACAVGLFKHTFDVIFDEGAHIRLETAPVRMRRRIVGEAGRIVPDIHAVAADAPVGQVADEGRRRAVRALDAAFIVARFKRMRKARLDGTEADADVFARADADRHRARIRIGKRVKDDVREFRFQPLGDGVDKAEHRAGRAVHGFIRSAARFALAVAAVVVLRDGDDAGVRMLFQRGADAFHGDFQNRRICEAELTETRIGNPFAVHQREVFRMRLAVCFLRHQHAK